MTDLEQALRALDIQPPTDLVRTTLIETGAADQITTIDSPFGPLWIAWSPRGVTAVTPRFACESVGDFLDEHRRNAYVIDHLPRHLEERIDKALASGMTSDVPVDLRGLSDFQRAVLAACSRIEAGTVRSYGWIAEQLENPGSVRAVGTALGRNPIPLVVPCHRVVRSDGAIGNYAFGPEMKRELLIREGAILM
ncbi:MAG: methylated-DNA--[protein]-cysteine S-methyltransferase [Acidimicrobiia bacterium]|nr:MAG: methylated-DNA--[protein]-cysteine S-methyltransferase [Acidimicrobiia bacterium]